MTTVSFESENSGDSGNGQLLREIEDISKALYLPKASRSRRPLISFLNFQSESAENTLLLDSKCKPDLNFHDDNEGSVNRDENSSVWPWNPLKAISYIWRRRFNCCFFCHVHHIESLPSSFDGLDMSVHWKRKDDLLKTQASRVSDGFIEFEDTLMSKCSVYGAKSGRGNFVKYEPKHFLLYPSLVGLEELDIGMYWIDLTRLLPLVFEELQDDKCPGKWTTSFKLGGEAKGATLHVSFGFLVMKKSLFELGNGIRLPLVFNSKQNGLPLVFNSKQNGLGIVESCGSENTSGTLRRVASFPSNLGHTSSSSSQCLDVKVLHEVLPNPRSEFSGSVHFMYRKLDENMSTSREFDSTFENSELLKVLSNSYSDSGFGRGDDDDDNGAEFTITEMGIELERPVEEQLKLGERADGKNQVMAVDEIFKNEVRISDKGINIEASGEYMTNSLLCEDSCSCQMVSTREESESLTNALTRQELDIWNLFVSKHVESESLAVDSKFLVEESVKSNPRMSMVNSLSLDAVMKAVADDFCNLWGENDDPCKSSHSSSHESPRERLWREFENEMMTSGNFLFDTDAP